MDAEAELLRMWNCLITRNQAHAIPPQEHGGIGAIRIQGAAEIVNTTIADNIGLPPSGDPLPPPHGAIFVESGSATIGNSIVWGNSGVQIASGVGTFVSVDFSNIEGGWSGSGGSNMNSSPMFAGIWNYRLAPGSPSINAGSTALLPCDDYEIAPHIPAVHDPTCDNERLHPIDLDGHRRIFANCSPIVDQGAYEHNSFGVHKCPDINGDGVVDVSDLLALLAAWGPCADVCDCPADLNGDGVVDVSDLLILLGSWGDADCENMIFAGDPVPQTVQDCMDRYDLGTQELEDCLQWVEEQDDYLGTQE